MVCPPHPPPTLDNAPRRTFVYPDRHARLIEIPPDSTRASGPIGFYATGSVELGWKSASERVPVIGYVCRWSRRKQRLQSHILFSFCPRYDLHSEVATLSAGYRVRCGERTTVANRWSYFLGFYHAVFFFFL